jgi:hypothetical protein
MDLSISAFLTTQCSHGFLYFSYGVAAVVEGAVSEPTAWEAVTVPPRQGMAHEPRLLLIESANDSIALTINPAPANIKCEVGGYRYSILGRI